MNSVVNQDQAASAVMDREHAIQTGLLLALCASVEKGEEIAKVDEILTQLIAYSSAHFMSEELLMRLASYDDYEDHVADHIHMMDEMTRIQSHQLSVDHALVLDKARAIENFLIRHVETRDRRFADWQPDYL
jgi:hemerythrin